MKRHITDLIKEVAELDSIQLDTLIQAVKYRRNQLHFVNAQSLREWATEYHSQAEAEDLKRAQLKKSKSNMCWLKLTEVKDGMYQDLI